MTFRDRLKSTLEGQGWYVRRLQGLPAGLDLYLDLKTRFAANLEYVFDVGAHRGETILEIRRHWPEAMVFAFEPVVANFAALEARFRGSRRIRLFQQALGSEEGRLEIVLAADSQTHSLNRRSIGPDRAERTEVIAVRTLDAVVRETAVSSIDLLKIDTEGFELKVLEGSSSALRNGLIRSVVCEASLDRRDAIHSQLEPLMHHLELFDFRLTAIYDQVSWRAPKRLAYFNALFVKGDPSAKDQRRESTV